MAGSKLLKLLPELLDTERHPLYDYLMRMTGQVSRSADTVDEVYLTLTEEVLETIDSAAELRVVMYTTARKFNADIWNADTSKLANLALETPSNLDRVLRSLPGREREVTILRSRARFTSAAVAEIMGIQASEADSLYTKALSTLQQEGGPLEGEVASALQKMASHPVPERSSQRTMNLSMVMQGIKTKPVGLRSPARIAFVVLVIVAAVLWYLKPSWLVAALEKDVKSSSPAPSAPPIPPVAPADG